MADERAKWLRVNATEAEKLLWQALRREPFIAHRFRRQEPVDHYIVDFVSYGRRLIVEVDGGQHNEDVDAARAAYLERAGFLVVRFWNNEVLGNMSGVLERLGGALADTAPLPGRLRRPPQRQTKFVRDPVEGEG